MAQNLERHRLAKTAPERGYTVDASRLVQVALAAIMAILAAERFGDQASGLEHDPRMQFAAGDKEQGTGKDIPLSDVLKELRQNAPPGAKVDIHDVPGAKKCFLHIATLHPSDSVDRKIDKTLTEMREEMVKLRITSKKDEVADALLKVFELQEKMMLSTLRDVHRKRKSAMEDTTDYMQYLYEKHGVREAFLEGVAQEDEEFLHQAIKQYSAIPKLRLEVSDLQNMRMRKPDQEQRLQTLQAYLPVWDKWWESQPKNSQQLIEFHAPLLLGGKIRPRAAEDAVLNDKAREIIQKFPPKSPQYIKAVYEDRENFAIDEACKSAQQIVPVFCGEMHDFWKNIQVRNRAMKGQTSHMKMTPHSIR